MTDEKPVPVDGPTGNAPDWIDDFVYEMVSGARIDGVEGETEVAVISEVGESGRYIASTIDAAEYLD